MTAIQESISATNLDQPSQAQEFAELTRLIKEKGLLDKQPLYYSFKIISTLGLLALSITLLFTVETFWFQLINAAFLAFVFGQIGYVGHDGGHLGVFQSIRGNQIIGFSVNFLISLSRTWWVTQHNQHHRTPNDLEQDPHTLIPLLAYSEEVAEGKRGLLRFLVKYQAFYFGPLLMLEGLGIRIASVEFLIKMGKTRHVVSEIPLMVLHFVIYFGVLFYLFNPLQAVAFVLVHQGLFGLYYGTVFAPNHKGMLIIDKNNPLDFFRTQVLTTRNVRPNRFVDMWYGGLNYQIEHHLFPMMPRNKLGEARIIIGNFCRQRGIAYHETGTFQSWREILTHMHQVVAPLRGSRPGSPRQLSGSNHEAMNAAASVTSGD